MQLLSCTFVANRVIYYYFLLICYIFKCFYQYRVMFIVQQQHVRSVMTFVTCAYIGTGLECIFELVDVHTEGFVPMIWCLWWEKDGCLIWTPIYEAFSFE